MRLVAIAAALGGAGCSLIYNPNNLPDPRVIDAPGPVLDANPCALALTSIAPASIDEGQGDGGSAPALLVIRGENIVNASLKVELKATGGAQVLLEPVSDAMASADHTALAFSVTAHVDPALGSTGPIDVPLDVTVTQDATGGCAASQVLTGKLVLHGLPELTALTAAPLIATRYSQIQLTDVALDGAGGDAPLALEAVSSIALRNVAASASGASGGPSGYTAGSSPGPGVGGDGGPALVLGSGGGGGGAGFAAAGTVGATNSGTAGTAGPLTGQDQIRALIENRASAGGKGGSSLAALGGVPGGAGGGGGGTIVLSAGGDITTGTLTANGGIGTNGGGGGGGGAGGTIVVRSQRGTLGLGIIHVHGGAGGSPGGGTGSVGRVRWDAPGGQPPMSPDRSPHRGPVFQDQARVVTASGTPFTLIGASGDEIDLRVIDDQAVSHDGGHTSFNTAGIATVSPALSPGYNQLCAKLSGGAENEPVANVCFGVAFLP